MMIIIVTNNLCNQRKNIVNDKIAAGENTKSSKIIWINKNVKASQKISQIWTFFLDFSRLFALD